MTNRTMTAAVHALRRPGGAEMAFGRRARVASGADLRRAARRAVLLRATARPIDGAPVDITIDELSATGFLASIPLTLREGMLLRVRLANGRAPHARVIRIDGAKAACEFIAPLGEEIVAALIAEDWDD